MKHALITPRTRPSMAPDRLWARHQDLQAQLQQLSGLYQQAQNAFAAECEKPEIERDTEALGKMQLAMGKIEANVTRIIDDLNGLDRQLAPHIETLGG